MGLQRPTRPSQGPAKTSYRSVGACEAWKEMDEVDQRKGAWSTEEDRLLTRLIRLYGTRNWSIIAAGIKGRSGKSCRLRYVHANGDQPHYGKPASTPPGAPPASPVHHPQVRAIATIAGVCNCRFSVCAAIGPEGWRGPHMRRLVAKRRRQLTARRRHAGGTTS